MAETRLVLIGGRYGEPRFYGRLDWSSNDVYLRHPCGRKLSRHSDGSTYVPSHSSGPRQVEERVPLSNITHERIATFSLCPGMTEPRPLRGSIRAYDLCLDVSSTGTVPELAVEVVESSRCSDVVDAWKRQIGGSSVHTFFDKGAGQHLIVVQSSSMST